MAKQRQFLEVSVKTNHPHPLKSPDYLDPAGSIEDNSSNQYFIYEIEKAFNGLPFRLLDLGCAGGQWCQLWCQYRSSPEWPGYCA